MGYDLRHLLIGVGGDARADHRGEPQALSRAGGDGDGLGRGRLAGGGAGAFPCAAAGAWRDDLGLRADERAGARVPGRGAARGSRSRRRWRRAGGCWSRAPTPPGRRRGARLEAALMAALEAGVVGGRAGRAERGAARGVLGGARVDSRGEPADRGDLEPRHLAAAVAARGVRGAGRARRWRRWTRSFGSTASGTSGTATCTTTSSRRAGRSRKLYDSLREPVKRAVHDLVHALGGSVGAEHGVGRLKVADLARYGDPAKLAAMRAIKKALDPLGILNPGAVLG